MRKVALVFLLAVFVPSLVLAWLAVRSLRDQQFLLERQQSLLLQGVADALAAKVEESLADQQHDFALKVAALLRDSNARTVARSFDSKLCKDWPLAQVGFAVTTTGEILSPPPHSPSHPCSPKPTRTPTPAANLRPPPGRTKPLHLGSSPAR